MTPFLYHCTTCGKTYQRDEVRYLCPACAKDYRPGIPLVGVLSVQFDYAAIKKRFRKQQPDWSLFSAVEAEALSRPTRSATPPSSRSQPWARRSASRMSG